MNPSIRIVIYEGEGSLPIEGSRRAAITRALLDRGYSVTRAIPGSTAVAPLDGTLFVFGNFTKGAPRLEDKQGMVAIQCHDIADKDTEGIVALVESAREEINLPKPGGWKPWFPVIDYDRCTNCMQCLSFCLFGVYGVENQKIKVQNQDKCKTDCPACSRVCPEVAILFPKYRSGPINGDDIDPEDLRREAMKVDISALLGGDIYALLRDRSDKAKSRFSKERDEDRALKERQRCLTKLQEALDIPPEVLAALPTPEQIRANAERATGDAS